MVNYFHATEMITHFLSKTKNKGSIVFFALLPYFF